MISSLTLLYTQINSSFITALKILSENNEDITVDQTIFLLSTIVNNQLIQSPEPVFINFTKVSIIIILYDILDYYSILKM